MHITNINSRPDWFVATYRDRQTGYHHFGIASSRMDAITECLTSIYQRIKTTK